MTAATAGVCGCDKSDNGAKHKLPAIPAGVTLNKVAESDVSTTLARFEELYRETEGVKFEYYDYRKKEVGADKSVEQSELLVKGDYFFDGEKFYGNVCAEINDYLATTDNVTEKISDPATVRLRGMEYTVVSDGYKRVINGKTVGVGGGLRAYRRNPTVVPENLLAEVAENADIRSALELVKRGADKDYYIYTAEIRADEKRLFVNLKYILNVDGKAEFAQEERRFKLYLDCGAEMPADVQERVEISSSDVKNIAYYRAGESFFEDFSAGKEIYLMPQGGGDIDKLRIKTLSLDVNFMYDGRRDHTNLNIGCDPNDKRLYFDANAYKTLTAKIDKDGFDASELTYMYFTIEAEFENTYTENDVIYGYSCSTYVMLDFYGE